MTQPTKRTSTQATLTAQGEAPAAALAGPMDAPDRRIEGADLLHALSRCLRAPQAILASAAHALTQSRQLDGAEYARLARDAQRAAEYIAAAERTLADLAQLRRDSGTLSVGPVEIADVLMNLLGARRERGREAERNLELALPGEVAPIYGDANAIERALGIMLDAAAALTPLHTTVRVRVRQVGERVEVTVRQRETTVPGGMAEQLVRPFGVRADSQLPNPAGIVPLSVASQLLRIHGGTLRVETLAPAPGCVLHAEWPATPPVREAAEQPADTTVAHPDALLIERHQPVVLVAEADSRMRRYLRLNLEARGYAAMECESAPQVRRLVELEEPDVILLDDSLPGVRDTSLLHALHASGSVVVLAQHYDARVCALLLDHGAADYVARPFSPEELLARVARTLRERRASGRQPESAITRTVGDLRIDLAQHAVTRGDERIALSKTEYRLLRVLAQHLGQVLAHDELLRRVWGPKYEADMAFLWVYVRRLRRKIEPDPSHPRYILTVPGVGYRLADPS